MLFIFFDRAARSMTFRRGKHAKIGGEVRTGKCLTLRGNHLGNVNETQKIDRDILVNGAGRERKNAMSLRSI